MTLAPGTLLGAYEILTLIGSGGMGEVYRARDTRLDRGVAIKVLPAQFAADPQLRDRFDREARAISSLNHPHICALYDVGRDGDVDFLVLELLEGHTLAERLTNGPLAVDEALRVAIQICDALDRAHRSGIVHRDLKPANVMLTRSGGKLLDFGLAKSAAPVVATSGLSMLPTTPPNLTAQGTILGTFQYMAPEQIEGLEADARTDIFAFGAVLFEMIGGRPAFEGKTRASLLGAILKDTPPRVSSVQPVSPPALDRVIATCLEKDPDDRYQSARDLLRELKWVADGGAATAAAHAPPPRTSRLAWITIALLAVVTVTTAMLAVRGLQQPASPEAIQFTVPAPDKSNFGGPTGGGTGLATQIAVSPDGRHIAFVAINGGAYSLWTRPLGATVSRPVAGTEGAAFPFWSPDSRFIAFFADSKLKKVQIAGGPPLVLCDAIGGRGGTWAADNTIVFAPAAGGPLQRVSAAGGIPAVTTALDSVYGDTNHRFPHFLPDGRHFFFTAVTGGAGAAPKPSRIMVGSLDSRDTKLLIQAESSAVFSSGHALYLREGTLMAQAFDARRLEFTGDPFPVADHISTEGSRFGGFSASRGGVLAYGHGETRAGSRIISLDRSGKSLGIVGDSGLYQSVTLSPDERRLAVSLITGTPANRDIWIIDLQRPVPSRLTFNPGDDALAVWSPDNSRLAFWSLGGNERSIRIKAASGSSTEESILSVPSPGLAAPTDWSRDGRYILYTGSATSGATATATGASVGDIFAVPTFGDRKPIQLTRTPFTEDAAAFSPDGRWFAYSSDESNGPQIYVQPFPPTGAKYQVSRDGGYQPTWRNDGREMFFLGRDGMMMAVAIETTRQFEATGLQALFLSGVVNLAGRRQYAVTKNGQKFFVIGLPQTSNLTPLTVVVNWPATIPK